MLGCKDFYNKTAARWAQNGYADEAEPVCMDEFCALLPTGGRVLDLCCGAGYESFRLHRRGFEPVGLEHTIQKSNPMFIFINGLFGCVFIRDKENEK